MNVILHITTRAAWDQATQAGAYRADSLDAEGFIHCSTPAQVIPVANAFYRGQKDLVLLCIAPDKVHAEIRYESPVPGAAEPFPHLYGPLNLDAVVKVIDFPPGADGVFTLPAEVAALI